MEEEKKIEETVEVEASTNPEDWEAQETVEELDVRECEEIDGGDVIETTDNFAE